jgi:hypothetical protein
MAVGLTAYLLKQGYPPGEITVLTPYLKQLSDIRASGPSPSHPRTRRRLSSHGPCPTPHPQAALSKVVLTFTDERDEAALEFLDLPEAGDGGIADGEAPAPQGPQQAITRASLRDRVRTATIDK